MIAKLRSNMMQSYQITMAMPTIRLFPQASATSVCPDTSIAHHVSKIRRFSPAGKIQIFDAATNAVLETIDLSAARTATKPIGGLADFKYYPVIVSGNELSIYPRGGKFSYGAGLTMLRSMLCPAWTCRRVGDSRPKPSRPQQGLRKSLVAADGTGDFCTHSSAIDSIPDGNTTPTTVYHSQRNVQRIIALTNKHAITLLGEDRKQTVIAHANNETSQQDFRQSVWKR